MAPKVLKLAPSVHIIDDALPAASARSPVSASGASSAVADDDEQTYFYNAVLP